MNFYESLEKKSQQNLKTIILPESYDARILDAVNQILKKKLAKIVLIKTDHSLDKLIDKQDGLKIISANSVPEFISELLSLRQKKNPDYTISQAEEELRDPLTFSCMMLRNNLADGIIAGSVYSTTSVLKNSISIVGLSDNNKTVSSFFLFTFPDDHFLKSRIFAYADCGVIPNPTTEQLSDIAIQTSVNFYKLTGLQPKVAFLSFSSKGSSVDASLRKVIDAYELTMNRVPDLICDGELQFDAAFIPEIAGRKNAGGKIQGDANVFIFPDLNSGNIAYKITERIGGASATGPIIQGLAKPVMDLSRGCNAEDIVNMARVITNLTES